MVVNLRKGTCVNRKSHRATAEGKMVRERPGRTEINGHKVMVSKENPELPLETDESKRAAHKAEALKKLCVKVQERLAKALALRDSIGQP